MDLDRSEVLKFLALRLRLEDAAEESPMIETSEVDFTGRLPIEGYGPGFFRIGGVVYEGPLALLPDGPRPWSGVHDMSLFLERAESIDILIAGLGGEMTSFDPKMRAALEAAGIGVEAMVTGSACRSYNVLLSEDRRVAAALLPL